MTTHDNETGYVNDPLVVALASGLSYQDAGELVGCSKATVARRMATPEFRAAVCSVREEYVTMLRGGLLQAQPEAVRVLVDVMTTARSDADRTRAARALLETYKRDRLGVDHGELERTIRELDDSAMTHIPEAAHETFIAEIRAIA
jgi:hypothetical protein